MESPEQAEADWAGHLWSKTMWPEILAARTQDPDHRRDIVGTIVARYWRPVHAYLRRKGYDDEHAKDLTQGFFELTVLEKELIQRADPRKGRFRNLLLRALENYLVGVHDAETAKKRQPAGGVLRLEGAESGAAQIADNVGTPEDHFMYAWAAHLVQEVCQATERDCRAAGLDTHWEVFNRIVVQPALSGAETPGLAEVCEELGIESESRASNMSITVKRRFKAKLREEVRRNVSSEDEVDTEIDDLMQILSNRRAGS